MSIYLYNFRRFFNRFWIFIYRSTHNELEKNRRAHLRYCLEKLKDIVPVGSESSRHTTLGLLTKAKSFIRMLEDREKKNHSTKVQLKKTQQQLQKRLESLMQGQYRRQERSISECSTTTNSTTSSNSESDEVDILGYGSSPSDTDESCGSDGYSVDSKRLVLNSSPFSESLWKRVKSACMIEIEMEDFFFSIYIQKLCMSV